MHNTCVSTVENWVKSLLAEQLFYTQQHFQTYPLWNHTPVSYASLPMFYRVFPTEFSTFLPLLNGWFSSFSTALITRATFSEKNYR